MLNQKQKENKSTKKIHLIALSLLIPVFIVLEFAALFVPIVSGFAAYPLKTIQCGHPPYVASSFAASYTYTKPGDGFYRGPGVFTKAEDYYCTESEVQKAGYKPRVWGSDACRTFNNGQTSCAEGKNALDSIFYFATLLLIASGILSYIISILVVKHKRSKSKN